MNIKHTCAQGLVCIGLNKKVRLFLHDGYPIMAYYNPIILNNIPIMPLYYIRTRYSLSLLVTKDLNRERFSITESLHHFWCTT